MTLNFEAKTKTLRLRTESLKAEAKILALRPVWHRALTCLNSEKLPWPCHRELCMNFSSQLLRVHYLPRLQLTV